MFSNKQLKHVITYAESRDLVRRKVARLVTQVPQRLGAWQDSKSLTVVEARMLIAAAK